MAVLLSPLTLREVTMRNRAWVSPMCQYSAKDGHANDWHLVHYGSLARGGAGLVMVEATAVSPEGRISPHDLGLWSDEQAVDVEPITAFIRGQGAVPAVQLAHAGRKASTRAPWDGGGYVGPAEGGWQTVAPSSVPFADCPAPAALTAAEVTSVVESFARAAQRAASVGFEVAEVHAAHGYLLHQFLSPLANRRTDQYGGPLANRARLLLDTATAVRTAWPSSRPVFVRLSATDWVEGGWTVDETVQVAHWLREIGVDLLDVSSGGLSPQQRATAHPGFQVPFARRVREEAGVPTTAVGLITEPGQAEQVLVDESADAVMLGRVMLREPNWPLRAAAALGLDVPWPRQYQRASPF